MTGEFPAQRASNVENVPIDDVIMFGSINGHQATYPIVSGKHNINNDELFLVKSFL